MAGTWGSQTDLREAKADDWLSNAQRSTEDFLRQFGWTGGNQQQAAPEPPLNWSLPSAEEYHKSAPWRDLDPTPAAAPMPTTPQQPDVIIQDGRTETKPSLRPGESVGSVGMTSGPRQSAGLSNPQKQALAYQEARASGLDDEGARILVSVTETEGGLEGAIGDQGKSRGGYQFHEAGQMPGFRAWLQQQGIQGDPNDLVNDIRLTTRYAATGYLGRAIEAGRAAGLSGADLATYVQRHGQVSENPERTGQNYTRLYGGASPNAGVPTAPAASPPAPAAAASSPAPPAAGAPMSTAPVQQAAAGQKIRVRDQWGNVGVTTQADLDRRPGGYGDLTILGPADAVQKTAPDMPESVMSAGEQKRTKLAAYTATGGGDGAPTAGSAPSGIRDAANGPMPLPVNLQGAAANPSPDMLRQPLNAPTSGPDTFSQDQTPIPSSSAPEINDVRQYDDGPRESGYVVPADPAQYGAAGDDSGVAQNSSPGVTVGQEGSPEFTYANGGEPTPSAQFTELPLQRSRPQTVDAQFSNGGDPLTDQGFQEVLVRPMAARSENDNSGPTFANQEMPSIPGLQAVYDTAGNFLHWIKNTAQGVGDQISANMDQNRRNVEQANAATGYGQVQSFGAGEPDYVPQRETPINAVGRGISDAITSGDAPSAALRAGQETYESPLYSTMPAPARALAIVSQAAQAFGDETGRKVAESLGIPDEEIANVLGHSVTKHDVAGMVGAGLADPTTYIGGPDPVAHLAVASARRVAGPAARAAGRLGMALAEEGARQLMDLTPTLRVAPTGVPPVGTQRFQQPSAALQAAQQAIGRPRPMGPTTGLSRMEGIRRWIVRNGTDNRVDVAELQKEAQRLLGRPLEADEMLTELTRANPSGAAKVAIDDDIRPALQSVADAGQQQNLSTLMRLLNNSDVAAATGNPNRLFPGGLTAADSQAAAQHLWQSLTPEQQKLLDQSSDALYRVVDHYRDEMVRSGLWTPALAAELKQKYPNWVPTKILDYMADPATMTTGQRGISLRDRGLRAYSIDGTAKDAEDPIASLVRYVQDAESMIQKNEAFNAFVNLRDRVPGWDQLVKEVPSNVTPARARGEKTVTGFVNGERKTYLVPAPMAAAIQMEQGQQVPFLRQMTALFREFITRTPMFVAGQMPLDAFAYTVREAGREGGPHAVPKVAAELAKGYAEAFRGLLDGSFQGDAARYLKEGGGMAGFYERAADAASKTVDDLTRRSMFEVRNAADAKQLASWLATGGWVQAVGSRVEMAPRVASFRLGEQRALRAGASPEKAALQGMVGARDVTLDFQRGGAAAKVVNQIVPFFNVGVQSATTLPRVIRENPKGATATMLSLVAAPTVAAEAWNRMDPQRSADYDDVPDYVKDRGIVIMLPGVEGRDERGERRPNYALIPMRELAPVAILARDLAQRTMGNSQRGMGETAAAMLSAASPVQASSGADLFSSFNPVGLNTGLQLTADKDFFRGGPIKTERRDENASALATGIANATGYRASQADFAIRDLTGGVGAMASAASDIVTGKQKDEDRLQSKPVVGGLASRFVGDAVGGNLTRAQDARLSPVVQRVAHEVGLREDQISPVASASGDIPLTRGEQVRAQQLTNKYLDDILTRGAAGPKWAAASKEAQQQYVRDAASSARQSALAEVVGGISKEERQQRIDREKRRKAS